METSRRKFLGLSLGISAMIAAGCNSSAKSKDISKESLSSAGGRKSVVLGLTYIPNVQFAPFYLAAQRGLFAKRGLDVTLRHHGAQEDLFSALLSNHEQVVCASSDEAMVAVANGHTVQSFATMYRKYPVYVLMPSATGVKGFESLRGKRVGVPGRFGSSWYGLLAGLSAAQMSQNDIVITEVGWTGVSALLTKKIDALVGFMNNEPIQLRAQGMDVVSFPVVNTAKPTLVGPGLLTTKTSSLTDTDLKAIAEGVLAAQQEIVKDPALGITATLAHVPSLAESKPKKNAEQVLAASIPLWLGADHKLQWQIDDSAFVRMSNTLHQLGITKTKVDPNVAVRKLN